MKHLVLKISGMHCTSCALTIDLDLEEVPGVHRATTNYAKSETVIDYNPDLVTPAQLKDLVAKSGYQVVG
jgi:Cu+-exporting ATPase